MKWLFESPVHHGFTNVVSSSSPSSRPNDASDNVVVDEARTNPIATRVQQIASTCDSRDEFLRCLAGELQQALQSALIAVESRDNATPIMLVRDDTLANTVDRQGIRQLLGAARPMPIASKIGVGEQTTNAMRVELTPEPDRAAMLVVQPLRPQENSQGSVDSSSVTKHRIHALQTLKEYTTPARECLQRWGDVGPRDMSDPSRAQEPAWNQNAGVASQGMSLTVSPGSRDALRTFHRDLDVDATAYRIANETRRILACDRVTVLLPRGKSFRVRAVSGVAVIDRRSNAIQSIEKLAVQAAVMGRPMMLPSDEDLPPQVQVPLDAYLDETDVSSCLLLPLSRPDGRGVAKHKRGSVSSEASEADDEFDPFDSQGKRLAIIVAECFGGNEALTIRPITHAIAAEAALAIGNATEHNQVFGLSVLKALGRATRSSSRLGWIAAVFLLIAALATAWMTEIDHQVIATGQAQPKIRRNVFAGVDGVVKELLVNNGDLVQKGDPLIRLENSELDNQVQALQGQRQTASERLLSLRSMRLSTDTDPARAAQLAMEQRQIDTEIRGLDQQLDLLQIQLDGLLVRSPISGRVIAWRLEDRFLERPVNRGNQLLTIADETGPWELVISIPDHQVGPVLESSRDNPALPVTFAIATEPSEAYQAAISSLSTATRLDETGQYVLDATATIQSSEPTEKGNESTAPTNRWNGDEAMIGADVTARIACDRRSVLASWFSDVVDFAHRHVFFHFR